MKKIMILFFVSILTIFLAPKQIINSTEDLPIINLQSSSEVTSSYGHVFDYDINCFGADNITAFQIKLNYDPNFYQVEDVISDDTKLDFMMMNTSIHGTIVVSFSSISHPFFDGDTLFTIQFKVIKDLSVGSYDLLMLDPTYNQEFVIMDLSNQLHSTNIIETQFHQVSILTFGDLSGDHIVSIMDATIIQQYLAMINNYSVNEVRRFDINLDGHVDLIDVATIQLYVSEFIDKLKPDDLNLEPYPKIIEEDNLIYHIGDEVDLLDGLKALNASNLDITASIDIMCHNINVDVPGEYIVIYQVTDDLLTTEFLRKVIVKPVFSLADYQEGIDLSYLPADQKAIFYAAAERYLLENIYGGVPLYRNANFEIYANRVSLFSPNYNGVLGFGRPFSTLIEDDSHVLMSDGTYGNENEYTWRDAYDSDPSTLNPWLADDSNSYQKIELFSGDLYEINFDETKTGFQIEPSLALSEPIPVNPVEINGMIYADIWQIPLRDNLLWKFNPNTDTSSLPAGYETLDASDYLWTYKEALDQEWFRAVSGGSDFISQGIKGVNDYLDGIISWNQVGLRLQEGNSNVIELEYNDLKTAFDVKYAFSMGHLQAINQELYEDLGGEDFYGLDPESIASTGIYYIDEWLIGEKMTFKKNELHPQSDMYHFTGIQYRMISSTDDIFTEFLDGKLDYAKVPTTLTLDYISDPRIVAIPQPTVWRMNINAFGTVENRDQHIEEHPEAGINTFFVPEPILSYLPMRQALYYGFNREYAAYELVKKYIPEHMLISESYFIDGEAGISIRGTDVGQAVFDDFNRDNHAYDPDDALSLFKEAVNQAILDGYYLPGTAEDYTTIELLFTYSSSGNSSVQTMVASIESQYEALLVDENHFVNIDIIIQDIAFPSSYYDFNKAANSDLGLVGIAGSILGPFNYLESFCDDNRSGFTMDWGIDTSSPNIAVSYINLEGQEVNELWSYNAITAALQDKAYIKGGIEQDTWDDETILIQTNLDLDDEVLLSIEEDFVIAEQIFGDLELMADSLEVDSVKSFVAITESGFHILFMLSYDEGLYELVHKIRLFTDLEESIEKFIDIEFDFNVDITAILGPLNDTQIKENEYLSDYYNYDSVYEIAIDTDAPMEFIEVYATSVTHYQNSWEDVTVVLHIGNYYITWKWL